jgi:hypothetical protein
MIRRATLAAAALAWTVTTAHAGITDAVPAKLADAAPHLPQAMPGPGPTTRAPSLLDTWDNIKDWLRPKLGRVNPAGPMF